MTFVGKLNTIMFLIFFVLYFYQIVYIFIALIDRRKKKPTIVPKKLHKYAVLIAARNESAVIGELIASIKKQNYPSDLVDIFVVADNCTDDTAAVAQKAGAIVYERQDRKHIGKGYALDYLLKIIEAMHSDKHYEGYFVFDADNLLDKNFIAEMNKLFDLGYKVLTSYRNSKNYDTNWITAGYSLWFLRESKYLNNPRMILNTSCAISGTGFLIHRDIVRKNGGWKHHLLTEDIEFTVDNVIQGETIGYCGNAVFYDEQPVTFIQSWHQRMRWSKGFYQVFGKYGGKLVKNIILGKNPFSNYDMFISVFPAMFLTVFSIIVNLMFYVYAISNTYTYYMLLLVETASSAAVYSIVNCYVAMFAIGLLTTITEWKQIFASPLKKITYVFTFPIFILTYIPISIAALFKKVEWKPICHTVVKTIDEFP